MKAILVCSILCALLVPRTLPAAEKNHERGWIGGEFLLAKREGFFRQRDTVQAFPVLESKQRAGIFVHYVPTNSPAASGGLQEGDLILKIGAQQMESLRLFRKLVDTAVPGSSLELTVWREGNVRTVHVPVGVESYRHVVALALGLHVSGPIDLWPNPDFSLGVLGFKRKHTRVELHSPTAKFVRSVTTAGNRASKNTVPGVASHEGWRAWLVVLHLAKHKTILAQGVSRGALSRSDP